MKKIIALTLVLALASLASAAVSFELAGPIAANPGETITLNVVSDSALFTLDAIASIGSGAGTITGAMDTDAGNYGWDYTQFPDTPIMTPTSVEFGGTQMNNNLNTIIGYINVLYSGGTVIVNLTGGYGLTGATMTMDPDGNEISFSDSISIVPVPEPITMALLGIGGLFLRRRK